METSVSCQQKVCAAFASHKRMQKSPQREIDIGPMSVRVHTYDQHYRDTASRSSRSRAPELRQYNVNIGTFPHTRDSSINFAAARQQVATHVVPISPPTHRQCHADNVAETLHRWPVTPHSRFPSPKLSTLPNVFLLSIGPQGPSPDSNLRGGTSRSRRLSAQVATAHGRRDYVPGDAARQSWG